MCFPSKKSGVSIQKCSPFEYDGTQHLLNPSQTLIINIPTHLMTVSWTVPECSYSSTTPLCIYFPHSFTHSPSRKSARLCWSTGCCWGGWRRWYRQPKLRQLPGPGAQAGSPPWRWREKRERRKEGEERQKTQESSVREYDGQRSKEKQTSRDRERKREVETEKGKRTELKVRREGAAHTRGGTEKGEQGEGDWSEEEEW